MKRSKFSEAQIFILRKAEESISRIRRKVLPHGCGRSLRTYGFDAQSGEFGNLLNKGSSTRLRWCALRCKMGRQSPAF